MHDLSLDEKGKVEQIVEMMGGGLDVATALRVLRGRNGNLERAINDVLEGNLHESAPPLVETPTTWESNPPTQHPPSPTNADIVDLTGDDDMEPDMTKALEESLRDLVPPIGQSSQRSVVLYNNPGNEATGMSHDDHEMSRAIEASMSATYTVEDEAPRIPEGMLLRKDSRPVSPRASSQMLCYAVLAVHALLYIPQLRETLMEWMPPDDFSSDSEREIWALLRTFVALDLSVIHGLELDDYVKQMGARPASGPNEDQGMLTARFVGQLMHNIQKALQLGFETRPSIRAKYDNFEHFFQDPIVSLPIWEDDPQQPPDLVSALLSEFMKQPMEDVSDDYFITRPKDIVIIQLQRPPGFENTRGGEKAERTRFTYPAGMYIDPFLLEVKDITIMKREERKQMEARVAKLQQRKKALTSLENKDVLKSLRSSIYYYENIARDFGEQARQDIIKSTTAKLKDVLARIEGELNVIDTEIQQIKTNMANLFCTPDLQNYKYDLRAVLLTDGLFGRQHIYSYVKNKDRWWKTVDYVVEEVSEEAVLTDPSGLHLNAGAFLLIYSRSISPAEMKEIDEPRWIDHLVEISVHDNQSYLEQMAPEEASKAYLKLKPLTTDASSQVASPPRTGALNSRASESQMNLG